MFFVGQLNASSISLPNIFTDIVNILTGATTTTGALSASFIAANCKFNNTVAPGWTNYDAAAAGATNSITPCVIRSAYSDDGTKYKIKIISLSKDQFWLDLCRI